LQTTGAAYVLASLDLAIRYARAVTRDSAYRLQRLSDQEIIQCQLRICWPLLRKGCGDEGPGKRRHGALFGSGQRAPANAAPLGFTCMFGLAVMCITQPALAQALRDPPTPFGPLVYDNKFTSPTGISDTLKNIPLGNNPGWYVNLGGSLRERFESFSNSTFGFRGAGGVPSEDYILHRLLLSGDFHFGPYVRTFVQFGDELEAGRLPGPQATDINRGDLAQGLVELNLPAGEGSTMNARVGRQEMTFGSGRLVDIREGPNIRQSFDGARVWTTLGDARVDAFWTRPVLNKQGWFDDTPDPAQQFAGAYATTPVATIPGLSADFYFLGLDRNNAVLDAGTANEHRYSVGSRLFGKAGPVDYNFEGAYQFGNFGDRPISAFALFSDTGYTIASAWGKPRFAVKADVASGGDSRGTGALGTFYPLFPKNNYFNEAGIQTFMNYIDIYPYVQIQPRQDLAFMVGVDVLWRENINDGFYQPPGMPVVAGNANNKRFLGEALNAQVQWQATANVDVNVAIVRFLADGFLRAASGRDITWAGGWMTFNF
jgi:alginate export protein